MKSIALITNTINKPGGAEYVTLTMFKALILSKNSNFNVQILGREPLNPRLLSLWIEEHIIGELRKRYHLMPRFPFNLHALMKYDVIVNTRSNEVLAPAHIHYLHWIFSPWSTKDPEALAYYRVAYNVPNGAIRHIVRHVAHYLQARFSKLVLVNSRYVADLLGFLGLKAQVLHPPVRAWKIYNIVGENPSKDNLVVTVSRIDSGKQLWIIPFVASKIKNAKFILIGSLANRAYYEYLLRLSRIWKADNFKILVDLPSEELYRILGKALIYLHTAHHEPFGIAVVESMAAGCIPVVHRSGGPYIDILGGVEGLYGYSFGDVNELVDLLRDLLSRKQEELRELVGRARRRALLFDEWNFMTKFRSIVERFIA